MVGNERLRLPLISQCLATKIGRETGTHHGECHSCVAGEFAGNRDLDECDGGSNPHFPGVFWTGR